MHNSNYDLFDVQCFRIKIEYFHNVCYQKVLNLNKHGTNEIKNVIIETKNVENFIQIAELPSLNTLSGYTRIA